MKTIPFLCLTATFAQISLANNLGEKLFLTPYIEAKQFQEARQAAEVHLDEFQNVTSYSGYLTVDKENNGNLFFWFFPSANNYLNDPVILWLQGGPGFSSLFSLFFETGPFSLENGNVVLRNMSWHKNYSMLYIDQPLGVGFSFTEGEYPTDQTQVGEHLYSALIQFFTLFSEIQKNEFYVSGESYAGKFVPAIGYAIHQNNPTASLKINLGGLIIISGLTDPIHQLKYGDFLYQIGLIDLQALDEFHNTENLAVSMIEKGLYHNASDCWNKIIRSLYKDYSGSLSFYNYLNDNDAPSNYDEFVLQDTVRRAIHVSNQTFSHKNNDTYNALYADITKSVAPWISVLLSHYRLLHIYGQLDVIAAYTVTENYLYHLHFSAAAEFKAASRKIWHFENQVAGYVKTAGNLTDVLVRNAGHMVPFDQPEFAFDLLTKFTNKQPIVSN